MIYDVIYFDLGDTLVDNSNPASWLPGAHDAIDLLRQKGLRLGLISNTGDLTRQQLIAMLPPDFDLSQFDESLIILSSEVGVEKPALDIFRLAVTKSCVVARRCLFCTEDLFHTLAAQQVGMQVARLQIPPQGDVGSVPDLLQRLETLS
jgi:putative hydrolase of the HAD superfamily